MARIARLKVENGQAYYHIIARIAGKRDDYPLAKSICQKRLIHLWKWYSDLYFCEVVCFTIMGSHFHLILKFDKPWDIDRDQLEIIAKRFYPSESSQRQLRYWTDDQWDRFKRRLFDVSEFMRNVQSAFAMWYNRLHGRRGRFWADRFQSSCLGSLSAVQDCMLYIDLNPIRAGLVKRPEQWKGSSIYFREINQAGWLMPLLKLTEFKQEKQALVDYRSRLYYRGSVPTKPGQAKISQKILKEEEDRGFKVSGAFLGRLGYMGSGLAIGPETFIREQLCKLQKKGYYLNRHAPVLPQNGWHHILREQRNTANR